VNPGPSPVEAAGRFPELEMMKEVWSSKKQARPSVEFKCCRRLFSINQGQVKPQQEEICKPHRRFSCASSRNMGASVEDWEAPY